ncbi:MAG: ankyrin repeat domain-containing protein, partial [Synergistaceae bacterium]|nr:ankyrin repeat domain-containing protein [Synergistaceae bacterium]
ANLNANDKYGRTALIEAATWRRTETVNALIQAGSNVKHKDNSGKTALDYARENYNLRYSDALKRLEELSR